MSPRFGTTAIRLVALALCVALAGPSVAGKRQPEYTTTFDLAACTFAAEGRNPFFVLVPGHQLTLAGEEDGEVLDLQITVLDDLQSIMLPGTGSVMTRVVEEREWVDGDLAEVSRNFFAICAPTNDVYYFGEDVDIYEDGQIVSHEGEWRAGIAGAMPGIFMPGTFLLGSRYYQEIAPGVALDRAEHVRMGFTVSVPAGDFSGAVVVREDTPLERKSTEYKVYAPGIGIVIDGPLELQDVFDPGP